MTSNTSAIKPPSTLTLLATVVPVETFDDRWAAWVAKGRKHEVRARRRFAVGATLVAAVAAVVAFVVLR